jgi:MFS family permease
MYVTLRDRGGQTGADTTKGMVPRVATTVVLLGVVSLLTDISSEMVNSILPIYLTTELGMGLLAYGFIDGIYQGVSAFVRIAGGYLSDRYDQPKWVATLGYGVSALTRLVMVPAHGFGSITAAITLDRLGKGLRTAPRDALIADASDPRALGRAFGVHRTLDTIGAAIGPLVAFSLLLLIPGDYNPIFVASFFFAIVGVAVIVLFVPNRRSRGKGRAASIRLLRELTRPRLRGPLIAAGLLGVATIGDGFLYLSLQQRDQFAAKWFPLLYVGTNVAYLLLAIPFGRLADRIGRAIVMVGGHLALLGCYLVSAGPFSGMAATVVALALLGTFYAATDGVLPALISRLVPSAARGSGIAAAQTVVVAARFVSSLALGAIWLSIGRAPAIFLFAGLLVAAIPTAYWLLRGIDAGPDADGAFDDSGSTVDPDPGAVPAQASRASSGSKEVSA